LYSTRHSFVAENVLPYAQIKAHHAQRDFCSDRLPLFSSGVPAASLAGAAAVLTQPEQAGHDAGKLSGERLADVFRRPTGEVADWRSAAEQPGFAHGDAQSPGGKSAIWRHRRRSLPAVDSAASTTWSGKLKGDTTTASDYQAGLNLSFDLDFFGRLKNLSEADRQNYFASEEARRAVHILLVSNVSQSYFNQRLAWAQLQVAKETLQNYQRSYAFVEKQLLTGSTNVLALEQARGVIESTRADIAKREGELAQANNALQLLLGSYQHLPDDAASSLLDINGVALPPASLRRSCCSARIF
jgi:outer membrane protein TolC